MKKIFWQYLILFCLCFLCLQSVFIKSAFSSESTESLPDGSWTAPISRNSEQSLPGDTKGKAEKQQAILPYDVMLKPDQAVLSYLIGKDYFNSFPENLFHPNLPVSRSEFVTLLYRASGFITPFVSEFPYFIDVPTTHDAYVPIEGFRMRNIGINTQEGYFYPDKPVTRMEAGVLLSKTLEDSWLKLSPDEVVSTFSAYEKKLEDIPDWARYDLGRSVYAGFLLPVYKYNPEIMEDRLSLELQEPLTRMDSAHMVYRRALLEDETAPLSVQKKRLPAGISLVISPTTAISQESLSVGQTLYFSLVDTVSMPEFNLILPKGTRFPGKITEISADRQKIKVVLDRANLPSGEHYGLAASLLLNFIQDKNTYKVMVPGENLPVQTTDSP